MAKLREGRLADELAELRATLARYTEILVHRAGASTSDTPVVEKVSWEWHWGWTAVLILSMVTAVVAVLVLLAWRF